MAIIFERDGRIATIMINRPEAMNALDPETSSQITEALLNVLMNAVESMSDGGTLTVTASTEPSFDTGDEHVLIGIADTGSGMTQAGLARCFERYFTTKTTGTGLGLAIVQRIIQAHDGTITAESTPGTGTRFSIRLPVR